MRNATIAIYLLWTAFILGVGLYTIHKMTDRSNPNSFISNMDKLKETLDANP